MGASSSMPGSCAPPPEGDTYEQVRLSFFARLCGEATRLAALSAALADGHRNPAGVLSDIREFAHRLRGAAAVFEELELSRAAKELELAAVEAATDHAQRQDQATTAAMAALAVQLSLSTSQAPG